MSKRYGFSLLALLAGLIAVVGLAQEGRGPGGRGGRDMMRMLPVMTALDADGDGVISAEEINNAPVALRKLDKNGDGKLTEDELRPNFPGGPGGPEGRGFGERGGPGGPNPDEIVKQLLEFDKNVDGQPSKSEVPERMSGLFERGDTNKDGILSKEELRKVAEAQASRSPREENHEQERRPTRPPINQ